MSVATGEWTSGRMREAPTTAAPTTAPMTVRTTTVGTIAAGTMTAGTMTVIGTCTAIVTVVTEIETNAAIGADSRTAINTAQGWFPEIRLASPARSRGQDRV